MRIVPWERVVIDSPLSAGEARKALRAALGTPSCAGVLRKGGELRGVVETTRFKLRRNLGILWFNSCEPLIDGSIEQTSTGSRSKACIRMNRFVALLAATWLAGVGSLLLAVIIGSVVSGMGSGAPGILLLLLMFSGGYALCAWGFWSGVPTLLALIQRHLQSGSTRPHEQR